MVKTAIRLEKDQERAVAVNDALREAGEDTYGTHEGAHVCH